MKEFSKEIEFLIRLWLPEKAAQIYESLLDFWDANVSDIASRSDLHRAEVYRFLPILIEKKLISAIQTGKRTIYRVNDPESLDWLRRDFIETSEVVMERIKSRHQANSLKASLTHIKGIEAISQIYIDAFKMTPSGQNYLRYSSGTGMYDKSIYATKEYDLLRATKHVGRLVIAKGYFKKRKVTNDPNREVREVPEEYGVFDDNISKLIYGDRVAIVDHDTLEAFVIESRRFARYEAKIFGYLWKLLGHIKDEK